MPNWSSNLSNQPRYLAGKEGSRLHNYELLGDQVYLVVIAALLCSVYTYCFVEAIWDTF